MTSAVVESLDEDAGARVAALRSRVAVELERIADSALELASIYHFGTAFSADDEIAAAIAFKSHLQRLQQLACEVGFYTNDREAPADARLH